MGKINYGRVVLGGIVAAIVATILDWLSQGVVLAQLVNEFQKSINMPIPAMTGPVMFGLIVVEFVFGMAAVWTYAAIRPRFGAGARTATYAGLITWVFCSIPGTAQTLTLHFPARLTIYSSLLGLVSCVVSTIAGAAVYKEEATAAYPAVEARQAAH